MEIKDAVAKVKEELLNDNSYRETWKSSIAMAYVDSVRWYKNKHNKKYLNSDDKHTIANEAAEHFLKLLCDQYKK